MVNESPLLMLEKAKILSIVDLNQLNFFNIFIHFRTFFEFENANQRYQTISQTQFSIFCLDLMMCLVDKHIPFFLYY